MKALISPNDSGPSAGAVTDRYVFTAASALDPSTNRRVPEAETLAEEVGVCLHRIDETLKVVGLTLRDLVKVTCWLSDEKYRFDFAYAYRDLLAPGPFPSRALVTIGLEGNCRVQIDAIAVRRKSR